MDVPKIYEYGWRQGSLFCVHTSQKLLNLQPDKTCHLIVATQDCNIVHLGNHEPTIDVFEARPITKLLATEQRGRNGRQLHVSIEISGEAKPFSIESKTRKTFPREVLTEYAPDKEARLSPFELQSFVRWLGIRYTRIPLPGEFNQRLEKMKSRSRIREILADRHHCFRNILLDLDPVDELPDGVPYRARIVLVMPEIHAAQQELVDTALACAEDLRKFLNSCPMINAYVEVQSDTDVRLSDLDTLHEWDFTDLCSE